MAHEFYRYGANGERMHARMYNGKQDYLPKGLFQLLSTVEFPDDSPGQAIQTGMTDFVGLQVTRYVHGIFTDEPRQAPLPCDQYSTPYYVAYSLSNIARRQRNKLVPASRIQAEASLADAFSNARDTIKFIEPAATLSGSMVLLYRDMERSRRFKTSMLAAVGNAGGGMVTVARQGEIIAQAPPQGYEPHLSNWYTNNLATDGVDDDIFTVDAERGDRIYITSTTIASEPADIEPCLQVTHPTELAEALIDINRQMFEKTAIVITI